MKHWSPGFAFTLVALTVFVLTVFGFSALLGGGAATCFAIEQPAPAIQKVVVGFNGFYKTGYWTPVQVVVRGGDKPFRGSMAITVLDGDGITVRHQWSGKESVEIPAGGDATIVRLVKFGRARERIHIELRDEADLRLTGTSAMIDLPAPLSSDRELVLTVGPSIGIQEAVTRRKRVAARSTVVCPLSETGVLPDSWLGFESVNTIVLATSDPKVLEQITDAQLAAIRQWVQSGGRMILCVGASGRELLSKEGRLAPFSPGTFQRVVAVHNTSTLETFSGAARRLNADALPNGIPLAMLSDVRGRVELMDVAPSGSRPMLVHAPLGFGIVSFAALDLDQPPFTAWDGRSRFVDRILREGGEEDRQDASPTTQSIQFGYQDMSGQLRSALDQYPGVTMVAFSLVAGLVLLYVVVIGPVDYFLLRDVLRRMQWTWISFPIAVVAFVILTVMLNDRLQGTSVKLNQLDLVDIDESTAMVRGTSWAHVYSPDAARFDIEASPAMESARASRGLDSVIAWHGLPGTSLGGLDGGASIPVASNEYQLLFGTDRANRIVGIPFPVASTRSLLARWWGEVELSHRASLTVDVNGLLRGEIVNPTPVVLSDCMVFFENWVYRLDSRRGVLHPGERTRIEVENSLNLQWRLSGRRVVDTKDVSTPWDQNTLDVWKILEMMMFHGAADGETYTKLSNDYQGYVDLSRHLVTGRAILMGRSKVVPTKWTLNRQEIASDHVQQWTCYRVVFPVAPLAKANP